MNPLAYYLVLLFVFQSCLGIDQNSRSFLVVDAMQRFQSVLDANPVESPPPLRTEDGSLLHPPVTSIYGISEKDAEQIADFLESAKESKVLEPGDLQKIVTDLPKILTSPKRTPKEVIEDAEDIDLGLPPRDRSLSDAEYRKRIEEELLQLQGFHRTVRSFIYTATPDELRTMRSNLTLAIASYGILEEYIKNGSEMNQKFFKAGLEHAIQSRMLVIDAMTARGISE